MRPAPPDVPSRCPEWQPGVARSERHRYRAWPVLASLARLHRASGARRTRVVAVVGSFGKTTTSRAVAAALGRDPDRLKDNYASFVAAALLSIRPRDRHTVIEVGIDRVGQMSRYARLVRPDVVVVTAIGSEHNRSFPDFGVTRNEKAAMVREFGPSGLAVLNGDDVNVQWMKAQTRGRQNVRLRAGQRRAGH
jgi:UDP-N-acetylmuramoyl-tripeptide--D-alanyl-D-alanine ligase